MDSINNKNSDAISAIIDAIKKPLLFASKNNFAHLNTVKGLEELIPLLAGKGLSAASQHEHKDFFYALKAGFESFMHLSEPDRRALILHTLTRLDHIGIMSAQSSASSSYHDLSSSLFAPISTIKGVGSKTEDALSRMNIKTIEDMLYCIPRTYIDRRKVLKISSLQPGMHSLVTGTVVRAGAAAAKGRNRIFDIAVSDGSGIISAKWFHITMQYMNTMKKIFAKGEKVLLSGQVTQFRFGLEMHHPEIELFSEENGADHMLMITPVYPLTEGIYQKTAQKIARLALESCKALLHDYLPSDIISRYGLVPLGEAFEKVHFPDNTANMDALLSFTSPWHRRIVFDEFFQLQTMLALKKRGVAIEPGIAFTAHSGRISKFLSTLPFTLTAAQQKALSDILADMQKPSPMSRLMQGDVGSGKTVVALIASLVAIWNGYQSAIMAPTEILAEQHFKTISGITAGLGLHVVLLTSSQPKALKNEALESIQAGKAQLIIGTHALIQEGVSFSRLGLAVIDEQHRFGVMQRAEIKKKGTNPDILVMTATPIPRTLGLTVYGDLDVSIINELPPGRKPVLTKVFGENRRREVYGIVRAELQKGNQAFIVYPLVEESEKLDLMDATKMAAHLQQDIFPEYRVGLVHGRMPAAEKEAIMHNFKSNALHILVATTVIEVGIDIPNASLMLIEHAERFGLSQLHQLRGRVGRGTAESICILLAQFQRSDEARRRLEVMAMTNDGFKIAEEDFNIRGPGEFLGTRQSGLPDFRVAHIGRDIKILVEARKAAFDLIEKDPELSLPGHQHLKHILRDRFKGRFELAGIG